MVRLCLLSNYYPRWLGELGHSCANGFRLTPEKGQSVKSQEMVVLQISFTNPKPDKEKIYLERSCRGWSGISLAGVCDQSGSSGTLRLGGEAAHSLEGLEAKLGRARRLLSPVGARTPRWNPVVSFAFGFQRKEYFFAEF